MTRPFEIGDSVRIARNSMLWNSRPDLQEKTGVVTELVNDGTSLERITVSYDGVVEFLGIYAGIFDGTSSSRLN